MWRLSFFLSNRWAEGTGHTLVGWGDSGESLCRTEYRKREEGRVEAVSNIPNGVSVDDGGSSDVKDTCDDHLGAGWGML